MLREALYAKIHHAVVTQCDPEYTGSITIDRALLDASGLQPNEKVLIADCENGNRFETYVFEGERGSGVIGINGAAALLSAVGHKVLILSFCQLTDDELERHRPRVIVCNTDNSIADRFEYEAAGAAIAR